MKKLLILFCAFLFNSYVHAQTDCPLYHTGYFIFTDSAGNNILIHRKNKFQFENNRKTKVKTQYAVTWISDCEYTIQQTLTNSKKLKKYKNRVTEFRISKGDGDNGYYYSCVCKDGTVVREGFVKKITKDEYYKIFWQ